jgi:uncharacterized protein (DUF2252 family)
VDFDDSGRLPFQFELLQGLITLKLTMQQNGITLSTQQEEQLARTLFATYRVAVNSRRNATDLLAENAAVRTMLDSAAPYSKELDEYLESPSGRFRTTVPNANGKLKEILSPADDRADAFAQGIAAALANSPEMAERFAYRDAPGIRSHIKGIVQRTRLGSSGSQGLKKYFVLLDRPLKGVDHDIILYLKQEIPCAAERAGLIPRDPRTAGHRAAEDMARMTEPKPYLNSWCEIGPESYWVHFKEPWSVELDVATITTYEGLLESATIWGTVAGATHREDGRFETILPRLTPQFEQQVRERAAAYVAQLQREFTQFKDDPRTAQHITSADAALATYSGK